MTVTSPSAYAGATAVLATKHGKQRVIAPALHATAGLFVAVPDGIDTDLLGTFTGEVERRGDMLQAAVAKARLAMAAAGSPLGLASEGSFGPHPGAPFFAAGLELLVLVDDEAGVVIREERLVEDTNFAHLVLDPRDDPGPWLERVGFPSHAVIVRPNAGASSRVTAKGLIDTREAELAVVAAARESADRRARIETDMRAHLNPTRMRSIATLARDLGARIATPCPGCEAPGFGRAESLPGLPCGWCGRPTGLVLGELWACDRCGRVEERPRPDGALEADPGHCPSCNP
jgi:hypothetical protein